MIDFSHDHLGFLCLFLAIDLAYYPPFCDLLAGVPTKNKFNSFGFQTVEIDGHDFNQIDNAFKIAKIRKKENQPGLRRRTNLRQT